MKNKIAIASAFIAASSFSTAEIVINDFLSFEGFVDMSYSHTDTEVDSSATRIAATDVDESDNSFAIDQVEIDWLFDFDPVTAQIDLQYEGADEGVIVEQAFATYHMDGGSAITAGRYASMLGFEAFEPTGLYQFSFAYDMMLGDVSILPGYAQGVKYTYEGDSTFFGISLQDEAYDVDGDRLGGDNDPDTSYAVEIAGAYYMDNGLSFFLGGVFEDAETGSQPGTDADSYAINAYTTFETGAWIFAAEVNYGESDGGSALSGLYSNGGALGDNIIGATFGPGPFGNAPAIAGSDEEVLQALLMANFAYSENASVTARFTYSDHDADGTLTAPSTAVTPLNLQGKFFKYTLAHGYAFTDNLFLVTELSYVDGETELSGPGTVKGDFDVNGLQAAVELIFSF